MRYLLLLLAASCASAPDSTPPDFGRDAEPGILNSSYAMGAVLEGEDDAPPFTGRFRVMHGKSACNSRIKGQGNPLVWPQRTPPKAGSPLRVDWTINPTGPHDGRPALLLVWFDNTPAQPLDISGLGYDGCLLWGPTKPGRMHRITPKNGTMLTQDGGTVSLTWTPGPMWVGRKLYSQLVVYAPGANDKHWLLSPALETWVGNQ